MERKKPEKFEDLIVWQKAHSLVLSVYKFTKQFLKSETFGLVSQLRRASISIAANIAEGFKKKGIKDKLRFFNISQGSLAEVKYYLILSNDLDYGETKLLKDQLDEVGKLLISYSKAILRNSK